MYYLQYRYTGPYLDSTKSHTCLVFCPSPPRTLFLMQHQYWRAYRGLKLMTTFCVNNFQKTLKLLAQNYLISLSLFFFTYIFVFFRLFLGYLAIQIKYISLKCFQKNFQKKNNNESNEEELDELIL